MVTDIVKQVMSDNSNRRIAAETAPEPTAAKPGKGGETNEAKPRRKVIRAGVACPLCGEGKVIKGKTAYGCSRWKEGCTWRKPFAKK